MKLPSDHHLTVEDNPRHEGADFLADRLEEFNDHCWPGHQPWRPLDIYIRNVTQIVAGLAGETYAGLFFVRWLWVSESLRGKGIGRALLLEAEKQAVERACHLAWLDTFSFQAPAFYTRLGYQPFGELDASPEHKFIFFKKQL